MHAIASTFQNIEGKASTGWLVGWLVFRLIVGDILTSVCYESSGVGKYAIMAEPLGGSHFSCLA